MRSHNDVLAYERVDENATVLIVLNIAPEPRLWVWQGKGVRLLSTFLDKDEAVIGGSLLLRGGEGLIVAVQR